MVGAGEGNVEVVRGSIEAINDEDLDRVMRTSRTTSSSTAAG
jgi:hypothetical protein